jgi:hypothetical protein
VKLAAQALANRGGKAYQLAGELVERAAQTIAQASTAKQRSHAFGGAVKAIDEGALHPV